jgi:hypothetical protein
MQILIDPGGTVRCLYSEAIELGALGPLQIRRASHVEPTADGQWLADMSPLSGPLLGPFVCRSEALAAEEVWIVEHWLFRS